jgi:transposase
MAIVAGFDVHRTQITFDALDTESGELSAGRFPASPDAVRGWVERFPGQQVEVAVEACTGWLFVCQALAAAGARPHLADPAETSARRGKRRRAKTDRADARLLRTLLVEQRLPEAWIPPAHVYAWRERTRLRKTLVDQRTEWLERIHATLAHHGIPAAAVPAKLLGREGRRFLARVQLPAAALERELNELAGRQRGCRALMRHFGIGPRTALTILAELGDVSRLSSARKAVRCAGIDIGVHRSDRRARPGRLAKQGSAQLRWALYEAAQSATRATSPDHAAYLALRQRGLSHTRASLTIARKLTRRCFHSLRELGPAALEPVSD